MEKVKSPGSLEQSGQYEDFPRILDVKISRANPSQMKLFIDNGEDIYFLVTKKGDVYLDLESAVYIMELNNIKEEDVVGGGKFFNGASDSAERMIFEYDEERGQKSDGNVEDAILNFLNDNFKFNYKEKELAQK